jgi:hypothetical protein
LGPVFAAVVVGVCALVADPDRRRALARRADVRWWGVGLAACVAVTAVWLVHLQREYPLPDRAGNGVAQAFGQLPWFGQGLVAVFGSTDVVPPAALHLTWAAVVAVVLVVGARRGRSRDLLLALALLVAGAAMLVSGEGLSIPQTGYWWQGRYVFPLFAGAVLVAGATVGRPRPGDEAVRPGPTALAAPVRAGLLVVVALCQVWAFGYALRHYTVGFDGSLNPVDVLFDAYWTPVVGTAWLWTICLVAGVVGLAVTAWRTRPPAGPDGDDPLVAGADPLATGTDPLEPATGRAGAPTVALGAAR